MSDAVLVTGAARGIGRRIATAFVGAGCRVWLTDCDGDAVRAAVAELNASRHALGATVETPPPCARAATMDDRDPDAVAAVVRSIEAEHGGLDVLVNNAGLMTQGTYDATSLSDFRAMVDVNVTGLFVCSRAVAPGMTARRRGVIVNIASVSAVRGGGAVGNVWYGTTKAAVVAMTAGLARELGPHAIRVNAISPGVVETDMVRDFLVPAVRERVLGRFPLGRLATADDVAAMALFLASPAAAFVTGQSIAVDGGFLTN